MNKLITELHEESIEVSENTPVIFVKVKYSQGKSFKTHEDWYAVDLIFKNRESDVFLFHKMFQPHADHYIEQLKYGRIMMELLNTLSGENLWDTIKQTKTSWEKFYERYFKLIDPYRYKECYIKTIGCPHWKERTKMTACIAPRNYISLEPNLEYTAIEGNMVEEIISAHKGEIRLTI